MTTKFRKEAVMLVLSRRENEKVLFPTLGVSVEIVKTQGKTVRLGIEAPREIRVIRAELADDCDYTPFDSSPGHSPDSFGCKIDPDWNLAIRKQLDAANLAIHLAKNQLRQGLDDFAEDAIDQALRCLQSLEETLSLDSQAVQQRTTVRESMTSYQTHRKPSALVFSTETRNAGYNLFRRRLAMDRTKR